MQMFSIRDSKSEAFNRPFFSATRFTAMREVQLGLKNDSAMATYAEDFELFHIADFDPINGEVVTDKPDLVCPVSELIPPNEEN